MSRQSQASIDVEVTVARHSARFVPPSEIKAYLFRKADLRSGSDFTEIAKAGRLTRSGTAESHPDLDRLHDRRVASPAAIVLFEAERFFDAQAIPYLNLFPAPGDRFRPARPQIPTCAGAARCDWTAGGEG